MGQNDKITITPFTLAFLAFLLLFGGASSAQERRITLYASPTLIKTGILKHIIPRFSLKHSIRVTISQDKGEADVILDKLKTQLPVFQSASAMWFLSLQERDKSESAEVFKDWLISEVGKNTIN